MSESGYITLPGGASAYMARPDGPIDRGVVLLPSMPGTTKGFEDKARDLAEAHGWSMVLPEIITEGGEPFEQRRLKVRDRDDQDIFAVLQEAAAATAAQHVALIGFCVGGMYAMKATSLRRFDRVVAFYGMVRLPDYWRAPGQGEPLDYLRGHTDGLLAIFGESDEFISVADIDAAAAAGVELLRYPDAGHAFAHDPSGDHYRPADADDAWSHAVAFITAGAPQGDPA